MDDALLVEVSELMDSMTKLTGLPMSWKLPNGLWVDDRLPQHQCLHLHPYCVAIKDANGYDRCLLNASREIEERALQEREPFIHACYAGAIELIVPFFRDGNYEGYMSLGPMRRKDIKCHFRRFRKQFGQLPELQQEVCDSAARILATTANYIMEKRTLIALRRATANVQDPRIATAVEYINARFRESPSVEEVARKCCLSSSRFIHLFKDKTGFTFSEYVLRRKIEEAKSLLAGTNMSIFQVAVNSGFTSQSYFGSLFRKHTGKTPMKFRRESLKANNV